MGRRPDRFREGGRHLPLGDAGFVVMREDDGAGRLFLRFFFPCCMIGKGTGHRRPIRTEIHMNSKYFSINEGGYSIRCKLYGTGAREYGRMVVYGHGFGGHKDTKAAERLAAKLLSGPWSAVNDSKKLSERRRSALADVIKSTPGCTWAVASAGPAEIDRMNILDECQTD